MYSRLSCLPTHTAAAVREVLFCEREPTNSRCGRQEGRCSDQTFTAKSVAHVLALHEKRRKLPSAVELAEDDGTPVIYQPSQLVSRASRIFPHARKKNTAGSRDYITTR